MSELYPCKNINISQYYGNKNYYLSKDKALFIGQYKNEKDRYRALLKFDLEDWRNEEIIAAYLMMNICRNELDSGIVQVAIHRILMEWDEQMICWNDQISIGEVPEVTFPVVTGWTGLIMVDISLLVKRWIDHTYINHGILLIGNEYSNSLLAISNHKNEDKKTWPVITMVTNY
ncbi:MAG: DNRLRE domain-containing protein [Syntrophomonadaceae bacterium]|nr:DNRLRE domain-containing protein [Syntrophomonadaceae bacterium]